MHAAIEGHYEAVDLLSSRGADRQIALEVDTHMIAISIFLKAPSPECHSSLATILLYMFRFERER